MQTTTQTVHVTDGDAHCPAEGSAYGEEKVPIEGCTAPAEAPVARGSLGASALERRACRRAASRLDRCPDRYDGRHAGQGMAGETSACGSGVPSARAPPSGWRASLQGLPARYTVRNPVRPHLAYRVPDGRYGPYPGTAYRPVPCTAYRVPLICGTGYPVRTAHRSSGTAGGTRACERPRYRSTGALIVQRPSSPPPAWPAGGGRR